MPQIAHALRLATAYLAAAIAAQSPEAQASPRGDAAPPSRRLLIATAIATVALSR